MFNHIPLSSMLRDDMPARAYQDCCVIDLPADVQSIDQLLAAFFRGAPEWFHLLLRLRNRLVSPLGFKTAQVPRRPPLPPYAVGQQVGLFRIYALQADEVVLGEEDTHLRFRTSLHLSPGPRGPQLAVSTWVYPHNSVGRAYFALIKPFHRRIMPVIARATLRQLEGATLQ